MVIEKKLPDLLSLLESHAGDATPEIAVVPWPPTPILPPPPPPTQTEPVDKKRKRDKKGGKGSTEEGEI